MTWYASVAIALLVLGAAVFWWWFFAGCIRFIRRARRVISREEMKSFWRWRR